jgi:hypothetical protein
MNRLVPCAGGGAASLWRLKSLQHVKNPYNMKTYLYAKFRDICYQIYSASLLGVSAGCWKRALMGESRMIRTQMGKTIDLLWSHCMGRLGRYHPVIVAVSDLKCDS